MTARSVAIDSTSWRELPLAGDGRCLVEASAGTGKTWTIAALYLRLLLECGHAPRAVVVTTFSIAAAEELRERIRARLREATTLAAAFDPVAVPSGDEGAAWLHGRWSTVDDAARHGDGVRLALALAELDLAPIGTLHSLCRRILVEHPFASGSAFDAGEPVDSAELDRELRADLWRRLAQADAATLDAGDHAWFTMGKEALDQALKTVCATGVGVLGIAPDALPDAMHSTDVARLRTWALQVPMQPRKRKLRERLLQLAEFVEKGDPRAPAPTLVGEKLDAMLVDQIQAGDLQAILAHPVLLEVRVLLRLIRHRGAAALSCALARYRDQLLDARRQRLLERGQFTYDALIERTLAALAGAQGDELVRQLREAWPVALVDEFQDTDAQQYAVLDRIYRQGGRLVMIGDPKQAIYGFRGGDVHAYLAASITATHRLSLATNFRSSRALVSAIDEVFAAAGPALSQSGSDAIAYVEVQASGRCDDAPLAFDGQPIARPLAFHVLEGAKASREDALDSCAYAIARLLDERRHRIGPDPVRPGDIAVLLPRNDDVMALRGMLAARGVPCTGAGRSNVFATELARDLQCVLHGIAHASDEALVRAALATPLLGGGIERVRGLLDQSEAWRDQLQRFAHWRRQWQREGVLVVVQSIVAEQAACATQATGERQLTDLRHLGELLQQQAASCDGPEGLLAWLADQRGTVGEGEAPDERQLRIESDRRRVQLMTVHASKGLEFPIVFLPLMDADATRKLTLPLVRGAGGGRLLDLGSADFDSAVSSAMFDEQDEAFRKLYVALTRARHACHVYVSKARAADADPARPALSALLARLRDRLGDQPVEQACRHVQWTTHADWPSEPWVFRVDDDTMPGLRLAFDLPPTRPFEDRHSFSSLTTHAVVAFEDSAASDEADADVVSSEASSDADPDIDPYPDLAALEPWRGERFGTALHSIFERRVPGQPMSDQQALVRLCLAENGFPGANVLVGALAARVQGALEASLLPGRSPPLRLADLAVPSMRAEMRFHYALDGASMARLRAACAAHGEPDLVPAHTPQVLRGLMTGAIDLVLEHDGRFHVLDYKSNRLGERLSDYAPAALRAEMDRQNYRLQALLYTVALDRYLRQRLRGYRRERQLGEAIYLFVRAAGLAPGAGVWSHRFDDALVAAVDAELARTGEGAIA